MLLTDATRQLAAQQDTANDSLRLEAEVLLSLVLKKPRAYLYTWPEKTLNAEQQSEFQSLIDQRVSGIPLAYLTGVKEFWSHSFKVTTDTLIPRPETELIVELSLSKLEINGGPFLDLGTGCGIIAISVAKEMASKMPTLKVQAVDKSRQALDVAISNAASLNANVAFLQSDWFKQLPPQQFGVIATNPPYIAPDDPHLQRGGLPHEPLAALRSCENGFADITAIISGAQPFLCDDGWLLIEHGNRQGAQSRELMQSHHFRQVETIKDLSQNDRVTLGQKA